MEGAALARASESARERKKDRCVCIGVARMCNSVKIQHVCIQSTYKGERQMARD